MDKLLISINNLEDIKKYRRVGITAFLFPLKEFSIGYPNTFEINDITEIDADNYILINRLLDNQAIQEVKNIICNLPDSIKGIVFDDIGILNICKNENVKQELILFQTHFATSTKNVNYWLNEVDSVVLSNEITKEEIKEIESSATKPICIQVFGLNPIMYSRRMLISNYNTAFKEHIENIVTLEERISKMKFLMFEDKYGTVMFNKNIYNAIELIDLGNIKYFYINTMFLDTDDIIKILHMIKNNNVDLNKINIESDSGFLYKETIYKLKERD